MIKGFDFCFSQNGELILNNETHDIQKITKNQLRIQLAYNRIKSVSNNWFMDCIGANLEELIGKQCNSKIAELGKTKIIQQLTFDELWEKDDIFIKAEIKENRTILYTIYLKVYEAETEEIYSYEIETELDLVKGVKIRFGWEPRRR